MNEWAKRASEFWNVLFDSVSLFISKEVNIEIIFSLIMNHYLSVTMLLLKLFFDITLSGTFLWNNEPLFVG